MRETVATVSRLVLLSAGLFALHCRSARLQTCCFSLFAFRLFLCLNQKSPFALGKFLAVVCSRYCSLAAVQVSLASYCYCLFSFAFPVPSYEGNLFLFLPGSAASFTLHRFCLTLSLFVSRMLCCPCWGTSHFSTFASDHENSK